MSRLSRVPRESVYPGNSLSSCSPSLLDCVEGLKEVNRELAESQQLLRNGTHDLKRTLHVVRSQKVFLFVNEGMVKKAKEDLTEEIEPQIEELIERAKKGLKALERRQHVLKTKVEHSQVVKATAHRGLESRMEARKLRILTGQRQELERELESLQRELNSLEKDMTI